MEVGDGSATSFWFDTWFGTHTLATYFHALLSHCRRSLATVRNTLSAGLEHVIQPRLSHQATLELSNLNSSLLNVHLDDSPDIQRLKLPSSPLFSSQGVYRGRMHIADEELQGPKLI